MTREELKEMTANLLKASQPEQQAQVSEWLTTLSEDYEKLLTTSEANTSELEGLRKNNEILRDVNAKLFLKVGQTEEGAKNNPPKPMPTPEPGEPELKFEDLFNEKGGLK